MLSLAQQKKKFLSVKAKNSIKAGSTAFLVSALWFNKWKIAVGIDPAPQSSETDEEKKEVSASSIPPIDNRILLIKGRIKPTLTEKYDYIILSPPLWKLLYEWYPGKGPEIQVEIIDHPVDHVPVPILSEQTFSVFYPANIGENNNDSNNKINDTNNENLEFIDIKVNKYQKISDIKNMVCEKLNIDPEKAVIRDFWNHNNLPALPDDGYIYSLHLVDTQELLLQIKTRRAPRPLNRLVSRTNSSMTIANAPYLAFKSYNLGHVGLVNLGNTCFFNSAVQALSHTEMLAAFFMNANWRNDINTFNRLSTNGLLTNAYAQIVNDIWKKNDPFVNPKRLFDIVADYAPRFGDHMQHDAQELMMFLLDGLHEDLNRANKNIYIEGVEGDSSSEQVAAEAAWKRHKLTNDSIIVDLFHGQLESQLECPICHCKKIVFDPYLCVTLPMPNERMESVKYLFVPFDMKKKRSLIKIQVISTRELDNIRYDAIKRFGIYSDETKKEGISNDNNGDTNENKDETKENADNQNDNDSDDNTNTGPIGPDDHRNCLVINRDELIYNFGVKLPQFRKSEYIVFEIPDDRKLYTFAFVCAEFQKDRSSSLTTGVVDGPILVEVPETVLENQEKLVSIIQHPDLIKKTKNQQKKNNKNSHQTKKSKQSNKSKQTKKKEIEKPKTTKKVTPAARKNPPRSSKSTTTVQTRSSTTRSRTKISTFSPSRPTKKRQQTQTRMQTRFSKNKTKQLEIRRKMRLNEYSEDDEYDEIQQEPENEFEAEEEQDNENEDQNDDEIQNEEEQQQEEEQENENEVNEDDEETDAEIENQIAPIFASISDEMQNAAEERLAVYWEDTEFMMYDKQRKLDLKVSSTISKKLSESLHGNTEARMFAEPSGSTEYENLEVSKFIATLRISSTDNFYFFERFDEYPYLTLTSMKVTLNPLLSRTAMGFKWQAVSPISDEINLSEGKVVSLTKCLECFSYPDKLDELNEWFCPTCRKLVRAIARLEIWSVPDNLILHLKRFVFKDGNYKKVFGKISFPEIIDMQPFVRGPQKSEANLKYKIHAIINHIGTMNGGHYTTSAFSNTEDKWFTYNDEVVYQTSEKITYSDLPYVLFYHRINDNERK